MKADVQSSQSDKNQDAALSVDREVRRNYLLSIACATVAMLFSPSVLHGSMRWLDAQPVNATSWFVFELELFFFLGCLLWVGVFGGMVLLQIHLLIYPSLRKLAGLALVPLGTGLFSLFILGSLIDWPKAEQAAFTVVARNAEPLINALEKFHAAHNVYPRSLSELVPDYLDKLPQPGIYGAQEFRYEFPASYYSSPEGIYRVWVNIGIEDDFSYIPNEEARGEILRSRYFTRHDHDWIFNDT